jgi:hypothetical protein
MEIGYRKLMLRHNTLPMDHLAIQTSPPIPSPSDFDAFTPHHMSVKTEVGYENLMLHHNTIPKDHLAIQTSPNIPSPSEEKVNLKNVLANNKSLATTKSRMSLPSCLCRHT